MRIYVEIVPHAAQRYATCGDWRFMPDTESIASANAGDLRVRVSGMADWRHEVLVAVHEIVEAVLCRHRAIAEADVDAYDEAYEATRLPGDTSEAGDEPAAPYHREHTFATTIEELLAAQLDVDWGAYDTAIKEL